MANQLDLANAQFIGFKCGKWHGDDIITLVIEMGLTKNEWLKLKKNYPIENDIDDNDIKEIDEHFKL